MQRGRRAILAHGGADAVNSFTRFYLALLGQIPIIQGIRESGDSGKPVALSPEKASGEAFRLLSEAVERSLEVRNIEQDPTQKVEITIK